MKDLRLNIITGRYSKKDFEIGERLRIYFDYYEPCFEVREGQILDNEIFRGGLKAIQMKIGKRGQIYRWGEWSGFNLKKVQYKQTFMISNIGLVEKLNKTVWKIKLPRV
ncbi:hypothetical protein K9L16_01915 [Candidatus Pacearchaeota archaeon]|nr:hypothetical protein [Candidatus Pacearchaeota archaeon]